MRADFVAPHFGAAVTPLVTGLPSKSRAVGLVGLIGFPAGTIPLAPWATAAALLAAFLIAASGCAMYMLLRRLPPAAKLEVPQ
ncbi:hypothetical protein GCM10009560_63550 [Nonomuraea longicatena]|uniref:Uncharacterized protein n=1 Tax=Nonomuraea longicatena TaxID=83682 RepID=A0ABN1QTH9_9ACTN